MIIYFFFYYDGLELIYFIKGASKFFFFFTQRREFKIFVGLNKIFNLILIVVRVKYLSDLII
jgi:hypothetical protein